MQKFSNYLFIFNIFLVMGLIKNVYFPNQINLISINVYGNVMVNYNIIFT